MKSLRACHFFQVMNRMHKLWNTAEKEKKMEMAKDARKKLNFVRLAVVVVVVTNGWLPPVLLGLATELRQSRDCTRTYIANDKMSVHQKYLSSIPSSLASNHPVLPITVVGTE